MMPWFSSQVFPSEKSRASQQQSCVDKIQENCLRGLRMGCSVKAAQQRKKAPWFQVLRFLTGGVKVRARNIQSEEDYFTMCVSEGTEACKAHAESFCKDRFTNAQ